MAYIVEPDVVKYSCNCGLLKPISKLFFCRHCIELRCGFCLCHEVDSLLCGKCLDNRTSKEAGERKNKCLNCFICPSCEQQLSVRASSKNSADGATTKVIYLLCPWCRWSTRDVGIPDQPVGNNRWPERENVYQNRLQELKEYYKAVANSEKLIKMDKEKMKQKKYTYTARTGITASMLRKKLGISEPNKPNLQSNLPKVDPAVAKEEVDDLPLELLTEELNLNSVTTMSQRLILPDSQPTTVDKLHPVTKQLSVKRSLRCRSCEHNVSKPEYNPNSIKFKIQLFAYYHIPEVRIFTVEPLRLKTPSQLLLKFVNPTQYETTITLLPFDHFEEKSDSDDSKTIVASDPEGNKNSQNYLALPKQPSLTLKPRELNIELAAPLNEFTQHSFVLPPRDDTAEYDDTGENVEYQDDPELVIHRKGNKAIIKLMVTPRDDAKLNLGDEIITGFTMQHIYTNTIATTVGNKEPTKSEHTVKLVLNLGKLVGSN